MKTKQLLFVIFAFIMFKANAQPPTAAPTPTHAQADVISVFSEVYSNNPGTDVKTNSGDGTLVTDYIVSGDSTKKYANLDYQGTDFGANKINASSMSNLHFDLYSTNSNSFEFYLINNNINFEQKVTVTPNHTGWNSYDIALTSFASSIVSNIGQFKYVETGFVYHGSSTVVYLDNIYFWKSASTPTITGFSIPAKYLGDADFNLTAPSSTSNGAFTYTSSNTSVATVSGSTVTIVGVGSTTITANQAADGSFGTGSTTANLIVSYPPPATAATTPTHLQANVISVYSDAYNNISNTNFRPDWGQPTTLTNLTISGNSTIKYDNLTYEGIEFVSDQNVSAMENLHFDIWTPNCSSLDFYLINTSPQYEKKITVNPTLSGWNSFDIPLSSYTGIDLTKIRQFKLVGNNGSTIYLDNIYFWRSASSPVITGFSVAAKNLGDAAFNLTAPSSNSGGAFTYTSSNTNVATISGSTVTIVGIGSTTITASQAADAPYTAGSTSAILVVTYPPPPTAAPVPTKDAADVLSVFSDTYTNISGTDFFPNWGQSTIVSNISIGGNTTKSYQSLNYQGVQFAGAVDASQMTELHLDIWTPNCTAFEVYLINGVSMEQSVTLNPTASGWNSFDISLAQYTTINKASIIQFKLVGTPFGSSQVFLDNIYFWKATPVTLGSFTVAAKQVGDAAFALTAPTSNSAGAFTYTSSNTAVATISGNMVTITGAGSSTITANQAPNGVYSSASTSANLVVTYPPLPPAPLTAAATPTKSALNVISLFSDAYNNVGGTDFFPNWGQSTQVEDTMIDGNTTKKYTNLNYQGIQFAGTIDAHEATHLHVDIWTSTCTAFDVYLINTATGAEQPVTLNPTLGGWNSYDIPLSSYNANIVNHVNQIKLVGNPFGSSKVYLDNIYFWANTCINHVTAPSVSIASSVNNVCAGTSVTITATATDGGTAPNYDFKVNGTSMQNGAMATYTSTTLANSQMVTCVITRTDGCAADGTSNTVTMVIKANPSAGTISSQFGTNTTSIGLCTLGQAVSLYPSVSGGVWLSSNTGSVSISNSTTTSTRSIAAVANGVSNISYTITSATTGCSSSISIPATVATMASPASITGNSSVCVGSSTTYTTASTGGVWATTGRATIDANGIATGTSAGATAIKYTVTNASGCTASSSLAITVNALPNTPSIVFAPGTINPKTAGGYCVNRTFTLVGSPSGGVWSKTGTSALTINAISGFVSTGATTGTANVTYTYTNGCSNSRTISSNIVACASRGILNNEKQETRNEFSIYPNPAKTVINFNVKALVGNGTVVVTDLYGKAVKTQTLSMGNNTVNIAALSKGIYLVSIITAEGKNTQKLLVD